MLIGLVLLFPLVGFLINGLWYAFGQAGASKKKASAEITGSIAALAIFGSFIAAVTMFFQMLQVSEAERTMMLSLGNWMSVGNFKLDWVFRVDSLSILFLMVISGVGTLIHVYSIGYMHHDETPGKFFTYLNLFCFSMLILVLGGSLPILFMGWEGVGLCSYLLIGYWYGDYEKASAGKKAFIVNRIGDLGFLIGLFILFSAFGTVDFVELKSALGGAAHGLPAGVEESTITAACILLFVGCMGKSAQIPLYVWLPDAMAGPTPVSALIHAATMVTSGVYLLARLNFLYSLSHSAMALIAVVGGVTAFFAATIALVQNDIKKVLAYSTVSQLGYMFLGCGVGAFSAGVFHVITHAFFKALLFLGAGSVIHGMHEEQDIQKMGGLKNKMPETFRVFFVGWLAICGVPPFSGFFSKDEILWQTFHSEHGSKALWALGMVTALMTTFYMTRLLILTFFGKPRFDTHHVHVHESPKVMLLPLIVLAVLSFAGGFMGIPYSNVLEHWLSGVIPEHGEPESIMFVLMFVTVALVSGTIFLTFKAYSDPKIMEGLKARFAGVHRVLTNKWYVDEIYEAVIVKPIHALASGTWKFFDVGVIDRIVVGFGRVSEKTGQSLRVLQSGSIQTYALMIVMGVLITIGYLIYGLA